MSRYKVWFVDDLPANRKRFEQEHGDDFRVKTFTSPDEVLDAIRKHGAPDALLCDIYFYDSVAEAEQIEKKVNEEAQRLRQVGETIQANREEAQKGIPLIEEVVKSKGYSKKPFPVYAYTSKGPYLLQGPAFDRIAKSGARWLLKGKYPPGTERWVIDRDIRELREGRSQRACWRNSRRSAG